MVRGAGSLLLIGVFFAGGLFVHQHRNAIAKSLGGSDLVHLGPLLVGDRKAHVVELPVLASGRQLASHNSSCGCIAVLDISKARVRAPDPWPTGPLAFGPDQPLAGPIGTAHLASFSFGRDPESDSHDASGLEEHPADDGLYEATLLTEPGAYSTSSHTLLTLHFADGSHEVVHVAGTIVPPVVGWPSAAGATPSGVGVELTIHEAYRNAVAAAFFESADGERIPHELIEGDMHRLRVPASDASRDLRFVLTIRHPLDEPVTWSGPVRALPAGPHE